MMQKGPRSSNRESESEPAGPKNEERIPPVSLGSRVGMTSGAREGSGGVVIPGCVRASLLPLRSSLWSSGLRQSGVIFFFSFCNAALKGRSSTLLLVSGGAGTLRLASLAQGGLRVAVMAFPVVVERGV
jgi:hypothetical protein